MLPHPHPLYAPRHYLWRTGRRVGRTIYVQHGPEPSDNDVLIGVMDWPDVAAQVVILHNLDHHHKFGKPHPFSTMYPRIVGAAAACQRQIWPNDSIDAICGQRKDHPIHQEDV